MYSTFKILKSECIPCTNQTLKNLGTLRGVFGAEIDQIDGKIVVSHTDEISRKEIADMLFSLGYTEQENEADEDNNHDEPSIWGCAL